MRGEIACELKRVPPSVAMALHLVVAAPDPAPAAHCVNAHRPVTLLTGNQY